MKKSKPLIEDIKITDEDNKISLLELKRKVGPPKIQFRKKQ